MYRFTIKIYTTSPYLCVQMFGNRSYSAVSTCDEDEEPESSLIAPPGGFKIVSEPPKKKSPSAPESDAQPCDEVAPLGGLKIVSEPQKKSPSAPPLLAFLDLEQIMARKVYLAERVRKGTDCCRKSRI